MLEFSIFGRALIEHRIVSDSLARQIFLRVQIIMLKIFSYTLYIKYNIHTHTYVYIEFSSFK